MSDPVDSVAPWTIKAVSTATRDTVTAAARREGLTVGQWLERRVAEWTGEGSPVPVHAQPVGAPVSLGDVAQAMNAARALAEAAGVKVPPAMAREGLALVRQATRQLRGLPAPTPRPQSARPIGQAPALPLIEGPAQLAPVPAEAEAVDVKATPAEMQEVRRAARSPKVSPPGRPKGRPKVAMAERGAK